MTAGLVLTIQDMEIMPVGRRLAGAALEAFGREPAPGRLGAGRRARPWLLLEWLGRRKGNDGAGAAKDLRNYTRLFADVEELTDLEAV